MIQTVIEYINQSITSLGIFRELHGLSELVRKEGVTYPAEYLSAGEYRALKLDNAQVEIYHRHDGAIVRQEVNKQTTAGSSPLRHIYPMTLVGFINRNWLNNDNA